MRDLYMYNYKFLFFLHLKLLLHKELLILVILKAVTCWLTDFDYVDINSDDTKVVLGKCLMKHNFAQSLIFEAGGKITCRVGGAENSFANNLCLILFINFYYFSLLSIR